MRLVIYFIKIHDILTGCYNECHGGGSRRFATISRCRL